MDRLRDRPRQLELEITIDATTGVRRFRGWRRAAFRQIYIDEGIYRKNKFLVDRYIFNVTLFD